LPLFTWFCARIYAERRNRQRARNARRSLRNFKSQREKEIRDSRARFGLLASIAVQFAGIDKPERAIEIAQELRTKPNKPQRSRKSRRFRQSSKKTRLPVNRLMRLRKIPAECSL
jgi:hypothetical protein